MAAPDHWATLGVLGQVSKWNKKRLFTVSLITSMGHSFFSALLGFGIVLVGVVFADVFAHYISLGIGLIMLVVGLFIGFRSLFSKKKREITPEEKLIENQKKFGGLNGVGYFAILGAALSPDLSITPIFLAAVPAGLVFAGYLALIFIFASILCLLILVQICSMGLAKTLARIPDKYNDAVVGSVIAAIGVYIVVTA